jgi:hypothetical protein
MSVRPSRRTGRTLTPLLLAVLAVASPAFAEDPARCLGPRVADAIVEAFDAAAGETGIAGRAEISSLTVLSDSVALTVALDGQPLALVGSAPPGANAATALRFVPSPAQALAGPLPTDAGRLLEAISGRLPPSLWTPCTAQAAPREAVEEVGRRCMGLPQEECTRQEPALGPAFGWGLALAVYLVHLLLLIGLVGVGTAWGIRMLRSPTRGSSGEVGPQGR